MESYLIMKGRVIYLILITRRGEAMATETAVPSCKDSIFIVDWDNTLFSTDYLKRAGFRFEYFFDKAAGILEDDHLIDDFLIQDIGALEEVSKSKGSE